MAAVIRYRWPSYIIYRHHIDRLVPEVPFSALSDSSIVYLHIIEMGGVIDRGASEA